MFITKKGHFDAAHRILNEKFKCFNIHGHTYTYELTFQELRRESIGYAIDAKEVKRLACEWIDAYLDHGVILNPEDQQMLAVSKELKSKTWVMSLERGNYCNPSVENIATELFLAMEVLFDRTTNVIIHSVKVHETPSFYVVCDKVGEGWRANFNDVHRERIRRWALAKGSIQYDDRK